MAEDLIETHSVFSHALVCVSIGKCSRLQAWSHGFHTQYSKVHTSYLDLGCLETQTTLDCPGSQNDTFFVSTMWGIPSIVELSVENGVVFNAVPLE